MDLISDMLSTLRLRAEIFLHSTFCSNWVIDINQFNIATFHLISHGNCWLQLPNKAAIPLHERDLLVLPRNAPHFITNGPEPAKPETPRNTPAEVICGPSVTLICGTVNFSQNYWNPLIESLPEYIILSTLDSRNTTLGKVIEALINECERNDSGSEAVIDRLADILFIEVLRNYVKKSRDDSFLLAVNDAKIGRALTEFHSNPGKNWDVQSLAELACLSRSAFAERFQHLTGISPMHYVMRWRMHFAYYQLTESTENIGDIAYKCGYQSEEAFSKAFRKEFGTGPGAVRRRETAVTMSTSFSNQPGPTDSSKILYSPREANRLLYHNDAIFIDVRAPEDYANGHITGAVNIPELYTTLSTTTPEGLKEMQDTLLPLFQKAGVSCDKTAIVYEDNLGSRYGSSCRGYFQLTILGHPNAGILDGGLDRWLAEGFPVIKTPAQPTAAIFKATLQRHAIATIDDILFSLEHPEVKLLDNRDKNEWLGISSVPSGYPEDLLPRAGRIPGARWIDWHHFMEDSDSIQRFKPPEQIRALCAQAGLYPEDEIIIYCFKGARASNTYIALKLAGFKHVRNYYGSWNEWSRNAALPVMAARLVG